jgi:hydroxymethylglutaryl-CoA lyase
MSGTVVLCECFARDGLQHESQFVPSLIKVEAIDAFTEAGFRRIEATSYSHPERVPAFRDASEVLAKIRRREGGFYKATCANVRSVERAVADLLAGQGANELSLLVSATESHTERNLRTTREAQWTRVEEMVRVTAGRFRLVGVISVALGCPFEGVVNPASVVADVARFAKLGVELVTIGDTTGLGTPTSVRALFRRIASEVPEVAAVAHFHETRGTALTNCAAALEAGCRYFDSAFGGVGGHPSLIKYGGGFTGNVATEDLVNFLEAEGVDTGLDLAAVLRASRICERILGRELNSMVARSGFGLLGERGGENV